MMSRLAVLTLIVTALLAGCGGGGVAAGAIARDDGDGTTGTGGTDAPTSAMTVQLVDASGAEVATPALSQTAARYLKVTAPDRQANKRVAVTLDSELAVLTPASGTQLTDAQGVALLPIAPADVTSSGVVRATAKVGADGGDVSLSIDLQVVPGSPGLGTLTATPATVQVGQSVTVGVDVTVDGVAARAGALAVAFSSDCGSVNPQKATVDATGRATAVIQTTGTGTCNASASVDGVSRAATASFSVTPVPAFGLRFVKADPQLLYLQESVGAKTSLVTFRVVDAGGNAVAGQKVNASIVNAPSVDFCGAATLSLTSGSTGEVSFPVCSGHQPSSVQVHAVLDGTSIGTDSNLLTVQSGLPSQRFFDIAATQLNFHAGGYFTDSFTGLSVPISVFAADRQGNPVPDGTPVVFVTEGGQINSSGKSSCVLTGGSCAVNLIGQAYRPLGSTAKGGDPRPGRVTVLAMADGEESFVDANFNNRYDAGEAFEDLGRPYLDKDENAVFGAKYKNRQTGTPDSDTAYPMAAAAEGSKACPADSNIGLSVQDTCNGSWNGAGLKADGTTYTPTKVRRRIVIVFSGGTIGYPNEPTNASCDHSVLAGSYDGTIPANSRTALLACSRTSLRVRLADRNGNPLPADATLVAAVRVATTGGTCKATLAGGLSVIGNSTEPTLHDVTLDGCQAGDIVDLTVTTADGSLASTFSVTLP